MPVPVSRLWSSIRRTECPLPKRPYFDSVLTITFHANKIRVQPRRLYQEDDRPIVYACVMSGTLVELRRIVVTAAACLALAACGGGGGGSDTAPGTLPLSAAAAVGKIIF